MSKPKTKPNAAPIDPASLYITNEPFEEGRTVQGSKFDEIFSSLPKNQRLVCATGQAAGLSNQLRKWLARRGHEAAVVRSKERCDDGKGGVWWLEGERAARPIRVKTTFASVAPMAKVSAAPAAPAPGPVAKASAAPGSPFAILDRKRKP
jgi:hypothetical protein